jgi:AraC-like DNA-binding protein/mannose-6-phosphate isomerase-like protein (cupin superfamily)
MRPGPEIFEFEMDNSSLTMAFSEQVFHRIAAEPRAKVFAAHFSEQTEWHTSDHEHHCAQLMLLTSGTASIHAASGDWVLPSGRYLYIPSHTTHSLDTAGSVQGFALYLTAEVDAALPNRIFTFQGTSLMLEIVRRLTDLTDTSRESECGRNLVHVLIDEIRRSFDMPLNMQMPLDRRLRRIANDILQTPAERRTLGELASQTGFSERTILRRFREETGMTVVQWVQHARILSAATELRNGASVKQASATAGYDSVSSFIRLFIRIMGTTPNLYRG